MIGQEERVRMIFVYYAKVLAPAYPENVAAGDIVYLNRYPSITFIIPLSAVFVNAHP